MTAKQGSGIYILVFGIIFASLVLTSQGQQGGRYEYDSNDYGESYQNYDDYLFYLEQLQNGTCTNVTVSEECKDQAHDGTLRSLSSGGVCGVIKGKREYEFTHTCQLYSTRGNPESCCCRMTQPGRQYNVTMTLCCRHQPEGSASNAFECHEEYNQVDTINEYNSPEVGRSSSLASHLFGQALLVFVLASIITRIVS